MFRKILCLFSHKARVEKKLEELFKATPWVGFSYLSYFSTHLNLVQLRLWLSNNECLDITLNFIPPVNTQNWTPEKKAILVEKGISEQDIRDFEQKLYDIYSSLNKRNMKVFNYDPISGKGRFYQ